MPQPSKKTGLRRFFRFFLPLLALSSVALLLINLWSLSLFFECENKVLSSHPSPDASSTLFLFQRDCGATTAPSYNFLIQPKKAPFRYKKDRIVLTCTDLTESNITWESANHVSIKIRCGSVFKNLRSINGITVETTLAQ